MGSYNPNRRLNTGLNRVAAEPNMAVTWLQPQYGQEVSLSLGYTVNMENPATQYRTGNEFHLEYYLGQHLPKGFALGLAGYIYNQMTADTGSGALLGAFHGQTIALGPCLSFNGKIGDHAVGVNARYYNEVKVHNRFDGQAFFFTLSLGVVEVYSILCVERCRIHTKEIPVMKRFLSLGSALALVLGMTQAADACTSIRIKTEDGLVFYARTMEGGVDFGNILVTWFPKARSFMGPCRTIPPKGSPGPPNTALVGMNASARPLMRMG